MIYQLLLVFIGGGLGSLCRYGIAQALARSSWTFPLATLLANVLACILLGFLFGVSLKNNAFSPTYKLLFMTGFCGGFSTFSTFSQETFMLLQNGNTLLALLNIGGSVLICLGCIWLGMRLAG